MNGSETDIHRHLDAVFPKAMLTGIVGLAICIGAGIFAPEAFYPAYLVAFLFWLGISLGGVAITMLHHLVGGGWGITIRRPMEAAGMLLPVMALFFLPIALGMDHLYPWAVPGKYHQHDVAKYYLNPTGFLVRTAIYFAIWSLFAFLLNHWSAQQDRTETEAPTDRLKILSAPGLAVCFLTGTFASIDWMMSLEPDWYSTIYGAMVIVGFGLATFTSMIFVAALLARYQPVSSVATPTMFQDLGNLTLAFVMLWAYMAFSQFLIIWCGNLMEEIPWYLRRIHGGWEYVALALIVFHFFVPFFFLLFRENKRADSSLMVLAAGVIVMHLVDLVWLVLPARGNVLEPIRIPWGSLLLVLPATLGIGGVWVALFVRRLKLRPLLPIHDPAYLSELAHRAEAAIMSNHRIDYRSQGEHGEHGHEPTDANVRIVVVTGAILVATCVCVLLFLSGLMRGFKSEEHTSDTTRPPLFADERGQFPEPRLQENPHADLLEMREADRVALSSYGWVDGTEKKIARIPIDRAMEIIAKRGLPQRGSHPDVEEESNARAEPPKSAEKSGKPGEDTKSPASGLKKSKSEVPAAGDAKSKGKPGGGGG